MRGKSFAGMRCSIAGALEIVGDRWSMLLVRDLLFGLSRYDDLRLSTDIPAATLAARLKLLVDKGVVERVRYQDRPPRDEYRLTAKGRDLWKVATALREWGDRWDASGCGTPPVELVDRETGRCVVLGLLDTETGERVRPIRTVLRAGASADGSTRERLRRLPASTT